MAKSWRQNLVFFSCSLALVTTLQGCGETDINEDVSPQGTIPLDKISLGSPESSLREAVITFVKDPSAQARAGGKTQYLSREKTAAGGQYMVQCKDGAVFQISILHTDKPVAKETALVELKKILPPECPAQSKVDEGTIKETYYYGNDYTGELDLCPPATAQAGKVTALCATNVGQLQKSILNIEEEKAELKPLVEEAKKNQGRPTVQ